MMLPALLWHKRLLNEGGSLATWLSKHEEHRIQLENHKQEQQWMTQVTAAAQVHAAMRLVPSEVH